MRGGAAHMPTSMRIDPIVGTLKAAGVTQHVGVHLDPKVRLGAVSQRRPKRLARLPR
jgi:hypothetical protein